MKTRSFAQTFTAFVFALGATATITQPSAAKNEILLRFKNGVPVTVARTSRGDIPVIRLSTYFSATNYTCAALYGRL